MKKILISLGLIATSILAMSQSPADVISQPQVANRGMYRPSTLPTSSIDEAFDEVNEMMWYNHGRITDLEANGGNDIYLEEATTLYVTSSTGDDDLGDGTQSNPFATTAGLADYMIGKGLYGTDAKLNIVYGEGTYTDLDVAINLRRIDSYFSVIYVYGTPVVEDTINVTHPGTGTRNYFIFDTDSTIVGDYSGKFLKLATLPSGYTYGFPIYENTSSTITTPGLATAAGATRYLYDNGTVFTASENSNFRFDKIVFHNISFRQADGSDADFDFSHTNKLQFYSCSFINDNAVYGLMDMEGVKTAAFQNCYFKWTSTNKNADIIELQLGNTFFWECVFQGVNSIALGGGAAIEIRPGASNVEASHVIFADLPVGVKNDGAGHLAIGSTFSDNVTTIFDMFDPRIHWIGQADRNIWQAGFDSIIGNNTTTNVFAFHPEYGAGHNVVLPNLKIGGYTNFSSSGDYRNNTYDLTTNDLIAIGGGVDTFRVNSIIYEDTYWDDLRVPLTNTRINPANSEPDFEDRGDGLYAWGFDAGNDSTWVLNFIAQSPHKRKDGTDFEAHLHWQPGDNNVGDVVWKLTYSIAGVNGTFSTPQSLRVVATTSGDSDSHLLVDFGDIDGTDLGISTIIIGWIARMGDATDDTYTGTAYGLEIDFHYQIDSPGSQEEYVK